MCAHWGAQPDSAGDVSCGGGICVSACAGLGASPVRWQCNQHGSTYGEGENNLEGKHKSNISNLLLFQWHQVGDVSAILLQASQHSAVISLLSLSFSAAHCVRWWESFTVSGSLHNIQLSKGKMLNRCKCFARQSCPVSSLNAATAFVLILFSSHNILIFFQILVCAISVCCFVIWFCFDKCLYLS